MAAKNEKEQERIAEAVEPEMSAEEEYDEELEAEESSLAGDLVSIEVVSVPQCVGCPHNQGAIDCDVFEKKPSKYISNLEDCPREK